MRYFMGNIEKSFRKNSTIINLGLERVKKAYEFLRKPSYNTPCILIGGTNGKSTTAGFLWNFFATSVKKVGLITSPHLVEFSESIQCSHIAINDNAIIDCRNNIEKDLPIEIYDSLTFFEVNILVALKIFEKNQCDINVIEVGLGGRSDATNIANPEASIIVGIAKDHQNFLGDTLTSIATEKVGIARKGKPLFFGSGGEIPQDKEAFNCLTNRLFEINAPFWRFNNEFGIEKDKIYINIPSIPQFIGNMPDMLKKSPDFMKNNFCLAASVYHWFQNSPKGAFLGLLGLDHLLSKFPSKDAPWSPSMIGRFFKTKVTKPDRNEQTLIIDVCHNINGILEFKKSLLNFTGTDENDNKPGIVSILNDKDINPMLDILKEILNPIVLFKIEHERSLSFDHLEKRHRDLQLYESFALAWESIQPMWICNNEPWVICGSVMAIGHVLKYFSVYPKRIDAYETLIGKFSCD